MSETPPDGFPLVTASAGSTSAGPAPGGTAQAGAAPPGAGAVPGGTGTATGPVAPPSRPGPRGPAARPRPRRRRTRWRAAFFALAAAAVVVGGGWTLLGDKVLVVRSVTVSGTHLLTPAQVSAAADVRPGTPLLGLDTAAVARRVESLTLVASATVTEDWPDHLAITVTERVPVMAVRMAGGSYDLVDPSGVITRYVKSRPAALPLLVTSLPGSALRGNPQVKAAAGVLGELRPWLARQVASVRATAETGGTPQVTLTLHGGRTVLWGGTDHAAQKNRELSVLLPGGASYFDVSAPGSVVTK